MRGSPFLVLSLLRTGDFIRDPCQVRVSRAVRHSALLATTIAAIACSEASAPIIPNKYIVTTSASTAAAGDTLVVKAQLADVNDRFVARAGRHVGWYVANANGAFKPLQSLTDENGLATTYFVVGPFANVSDIILVSDEDHLQGHSDAIAVVPAQPTVYAVTTNTTAPSIGSTISVSAQLADKFGNKTPVAGRVVTWSTSPSNGGYYYQIGARTNRLLAPDHGPRLNTESGTFDTPQSTTNSQGVATVNFNVGTTASAAYVITAQDGGGATGYSSPIIVQPGPPTKFVVTVGVSDPPAGATVLITATASDAYDNAVSTPGTSVQWTATGAGAALSSTTSTLDQGGVATTRLTTGSTPGTSYTVTASNPQSNATGTSPTITTLEQVSLASMAAGFGNESSCGIATDGKVWCWGTQGGLRARPMPGKPIGDQAVSALSTNAHTCAISAGTVICWGSNGSGELGDNTRTSRGTAAPISSSLSFTAVSTGPGHTCALTTAGDIYCWGAPEDGRLGDGTGYTGLTPIKVAGSVSFTALSAGRAHTCAIATSGDAYCWGANEAGQLGNGSFTSASIPTLVGGVGFKFTAISAGDSHTCGITDTGVLCWGDNTFGQIGDGLTGTHRVAPSPVKNSSTFVTIAVGGFHSCALASDGKAFCWGDNTTGELGDPDNTLNHAATPMPVAGGFAFKSIAAGGGGYTGDDYYYYGPYAFGYTCAVTTGGVAYCWGQNGAGELGTSTFNSAPSAAPLKVDGQH